MAVGNAVLDELSKPELLEHVREVAGYLTQQLEGLKDRYPDVVVDIRGKGLLIGLKLATTTASSCSMRARRSSLLIAGGGDNCVRLLPPLIVTEDEAREAIDSRATCEVGRAKMTPRRA